MNRAVSRYRTRHVALNMPPITLAALPQSGGALIEEPAGPLPVLKNRQKLTEFIGNVEIYRQGFAGDIGFRSGTWTPFLPLGRR